MYILINDQEIYYQKVGKGSNLILLHGWGQDSSTWWGIAEPLKDYFTLWLIDLPGFGRSGAPKKPFTVSDYSSIISEFIKKNGIKKPIVLGHSLGGRIAIKLASHPPGGNVIDRLILESSAGVKPKRDILKFFIYPVAKIFRYIAPNWFNLKEKLRHLFYRSLEADYIDAGVLKDTLTNILSEDLTPDLSKIEAETLLIWGEKDPTKEASIKNAKKMYKLIEHSRLEIINNIGHFPHLENPSMFVYLVKDFCS